MTEDIHKRRIMLVTGLSGAGKSTVLRTLEDIGWEAIDNFPLRLLDRLLATPPSSNQDIEERPLAIGFDARTRGFDPAETIGRIKNMNERDDLSISTMFIDCTTGELERRYNETRRRHPLANDRPASDGIAQERLLLTPLKRWADIAIDTTNYSTQALQDDIRQRFAERAERQTVVTVSSFGFARGLPPVADLIFDMRFLNNPHWVPELKPLTGLDSSIGDYVRQDEAWETAYGQIRDLLCTLLPRYQQQGKAYVNIAFGCTGGRHRSVFTAETIAGDLRQAGFSPTVLHRNLKSRSVDELERLN